MLLTVIIIGLIALLQSTQRELTTVRAEATAAALIRPTTVMNPTQGDAPSPIPTLAVPAVVPLLEDTFTEAINPALWQFTMDDWRFIDQRMTARSSRAELISQGADFQNYRLEIWFRGQGNYHIAYNLTEADDQGFSLSLNVVGASLNAATLRHASLDRLTGSQVIDRASGLNIFPTDDSYYLRIDVKGDHSIVFVQDREILNVRPVDGSSAGRIAIIVPNNSQLEQVRITPLGD
jgi:hypothetical protein